ncbi:hypothetical protein PN462_00670 [Spirulina sp. CS-785/01]|uniref:hypothetical protein n=1 Tax=Spirulina sp. CS-785/01 TaxID=3021716 RepID=UPI00232FB8B8|nr:hypothetical protein [Spirulina sp. CS-785/01]MDB9311594.1 hypothetical protein [Spirulina sp. CS-785/01]
MSLESGSLAYKIKPSEKFKTSFVALRKSHYKKSKKLQTQFKETIQKKVEEISSEPRCADLEPIPSNLKLPEHLELRKLHFKMPNLQGESRQGRLIYIVNHEKQEIDLVWLYTHKEFQKRPSDKNLQQVILDIRSQIET